MSIVLPPKSMFDSTIQQTPHCHTIERNDIKKCSGIFGFLLILIIIFALGLLGLVLVAFGN